MSERESGRRGSCKRRGSRDRDKQSDSSQRSIDKNRRSRSCSRSHSRSRSPQTHRHSRHRHGRDSDRERHSRHKKHKRHRDDKDDRSHKHSSHRRQSRSPSTSPDPPLSTAHSSEAPPFPSTTSLDAARSLLASLVALDPTSCDDLLFLLFQLDHQQSIIIQHIGHAEARQMLQQLVEVLGLQRTTDEGGEERWKVWAAWGDRKLLPELESVLNAAKKQQRKQPTDVQEETKADIDETAEVRESVDRVHPTAVIGPALPPPSYRPTARPQSPQPAHHAEREQAEGDEEEEDDDAGYGPRLAAQLTVEETHALAQLQQARQHLNDTTQHINTLRTAASTYPTTHPSTHEEWMTVVPAAMSGQAALMASMTGDRAMQGRTFNVRGGGSSSGGVRDSSGWTAGPEEREWKRVEREAERAVDKALAHLRAVQQRVYGKTNSAAASTKASLPRASAAAVVSSTSSAAVPTLVELHQEKLKAEQSSAVRERGAPIFWDREKEMGMRRHKTGSQIASEIRGASELSSRFAMGT